ncbi:hypothetical protein LJR168_003756 [Pseudoxanthomonas sp. LjRoot168]|uniref:hypothetical protein n=1 Tax=unclassified Pseudoxanthomonas TaxID=2645906 RepID=UPI003ECF4A8F
MTDVSNIWPTLNRLSRQDKVDILEAHGYACSDSEDEASFDNTILEDVESGEIEMSELEDKLGTGPRMR